MSRAQLIVKNTFSLLLSGILAQILGFATAIYLARTLTADGFGYVSFALSIMAYVTTAGNMGLPLLGTREIARHKDQTRSLVASILALRSLFSIASLCALCVLLVFAHISKEAKQLTAFYGLSLIPLALLLDWVFQGWERMELTGLSRLIGVGVYASLVFAFVKSEAQLLWTPWLQMASYSLGTLFLLVILARTGNLAGPAFDRNLWKRLLPQAIPIGLSMLMVQFIWYMDITTLGFIRSPAEVGNYSAAHKVILGILVASGAYYDAIFPVMSNYYQKSLEALRKLQTYTLALILLVAVPMVVGGVVLAQPLMRLIYGSKYDSASIAFQILIVMAGVALVNTVYARGLWACDRQNTYLYIVVAQAFVSISLSLCLVPGLGLRGAALARLAAEALGLGLYYKAFNKIAAIPLVKSLWRPLLSSLPMALTLAAAIPAGCHVLFLITIGGLVYIAMMFLVGGVVPEDRRLIQSLLARRPAALNSDTQERHRL